MSIRFRLSQGERRIPQRRKPIECQYPKCKKEATRSLSMNDLDVEKYYYCDEHCKKIKINTIFSMQRKNRKG